MISFSQSFRKYFYNTSWLVVEKIIRILALGVVGIFVARYLQPERYGLLNYALSLGGLVAALSSMGMDSVLIKHIVAGKEKENVLLGTSWMLRVISLIFLNGLLFLFISGEDKLTTLMVMIIGFSMLLQSFSVIELYFRSQVEAKYSVIVQFGQIIFSSALKILLIFLKAPLIYFATVTVVESAFLAGGLIFFYLKKKKVVFDWKFKIKTAKKILIASWPLMIADAMSSINMRVDQIILKNLINISSVGQYAVAARLSETWYFIPIAIVNSVYPALIKAKSTNKKVYDSRFQQLYSLLFWVALIVSILTTIFSKSIIKILYGQSYIPAAHVLSILIWSSVFVFFGVVNSKWMLIENMQKYLTLSKAVGAGINILLNFLLIPVMGIVGSAWASLISYAVASLLPFVIIKKLRSHLYIMAKSIIAPINISEIIKS